MRETLSPEIERCRVDGSPNSGPHGAFRILCPVLSRTLNVVVSDGRDWGEVAPAPTPQDLAGFPAALREKILSRYAGRDQIGPFPLPAWEHVSVSARAFCPSWLEMCWVKDLFFLPEEWVVQYHPAKDDHINDHERTLHMWRPIGVELPIPPKECV